MPPPSNRGNSRPRRDAELKKQRQDRIGYGVLAGCGLLLAATGAVFALTQNSVQRDKVTGCPLDGQKIPAHTIVLVDETDRLPRSELRFAQDLINTEYQWLPIGGRLTVRNILADPDEAADITVCRVDKGGSNGVSLTSNPRQLKRAFERTAGLKLKRLVDDLASAKPQTASPIFEAAADVANRSDFGRSVPQRRLVIISDLVQHSKLADQYKGVSGRADDIAGIHNLDPDFEGVDVRLQYVKRPELARIQGDGHRRYWQAWFKHQHAASTQVGHDLLLGEVPTRPVYVAQPSTNTSEKRS